MSDDEKRDIIQKRAAIYARTAAEQMTNDALRNQIEQCTTYCTEHNYTIEHVYQETAAGTQQGRPGLNALLTKAKNGEFEILVVRTFDRLSRSNAQLSALLRELQASSITVESVQEDRASHK